MTLTVTARAKFRVKIRSLAEEATIIRQEEAKLRRRWHTVSKDASRRELADHIRYAREAIHEHRVGVLRREARNTQLAYALARGIPYASVEPKGKQPINTKRVWEIVKSLTGQAITAIEMGEWIRGGQSAGCPAA